jgi:flagella basal body P-ring formation protein FlgA
MPRNRTVDKAALTLDDVAIISGRDDALAAKVRAVKLGRAPFAGESITINRQTILSQLAAAEISTEPLEIMGSDETAVHRKATDISTDDIIAAAQAYIEANPPAAAIRWTLATRPKDIALPAQKGATLLCQTDPTSPDGQMHVRVLLATDEKVLATRLVIFRLTYRSRQLVAKADIPPGEAVTPANTTLETIEVTHKPEEMYVPPFGKRARVHILAGTRITESHVHEPKPEIVIRRNQTVRMRIQGNGWCITALGKALQNGRPGETIRVQNLDSRRIVAGEIDENGFVVPIMPGGEMAAKEQNR